VAHVTRSVGGAGPANDAAWLNGSYYAYSRGIRVLGGMRLPAAAGGGGGGGGGTQLLVEGTVEQGLRPTLDGWQVASQRQSELAEGRVMTGPQSPS
jgi:hypothetical protein